MSAFSEVTEGQLRLVVVGTSAGGLEALMKLLPDLPGDFPAALLVVMHLSAESNIPVIRNALQRNSKLPCLIAEHDQFIEPGKVYLPPADHHLLVQGNRLQLSRGARENRWRPGIDPLFRSAAVAFGSAVTGVVLTGMLDDGTAGMHAIKSCGGTTVVQDPAEAQFPDMVQHVLNNVTVDHCVPLAQIGKLLASLVAQPVAERTEIPAQIAREAEIARRMIVSLEMMEEVGESSGFICPECGGPLFEIKDEQNPRFRCFTGHTYGAHTLLHRKATELEEAIWASVRLLEERRNMYQLMAQRQLTQQPTNFRNTAEMEEKAEQARRYINHLREALLQINSHLKANPGTDSQRWS